MEAEPGLDPTLRRITAKSNVTTPIMRGDAVIGAIGMGSREKGARQSRSGCEPGPSVPVLPTAMRACQQKSSPNARTMAMPAKFRRNLGKVIRLCAKFS